MTSELDFSVTMGLETAYGTPVTPTRSFESDANFKLDQPTVQSKGMRPTKRFNRLRRHSVQRREVSGTVGIDIPTKGAGFLFAAFFGALTNTNVSGGLFQQVHTMLRSDPMPSYTIQEILEVIGGGAGNPHTFVGCLADTLDLSVTEGNYLGLKIGFVGRDLSTAAPAAGANYPVGDDLFTFVQGQIGIGAGSLTPPTTTALATLSSGQRTDVVDFTLALKNNLDKNGYNLGGAGLRARKNVIGPADATGKVTVEYTGNDLRDAYLAQTPLVLLLTFTSGANVLQVVLSAIRLKGEIPTSNGGDVEKMSIDFEAFDDDSGNEAVYFVYRTSDTAP